MSDPRPPSPAERAAERFAAALDASSTLAHERCEKIAAQAAAIFAEEYAPLVDALTAIGNGPCFCEEPEPGEVGTVKCDRCVARAALGAEGGKR